MPAEESARTNPEDSPDAEKDIARILFRVSAVFLLALAMFLYGFVVHRDQVFPYGLLAEARLVYGRLRLHKWYKRTEEEGSQVVKTYEADAVQPGYNLVTRSMAGRKSAVTLMDMQGEVIHEWIIDWFDLGLPDSHVPGYRKPKARPGTEILDTLLLKNGNIVFSFEYIALVCLAPDGEVQWTLPYQTHHSVHQAEDGNLWVCGRKVSWEADPRFPDYGPPYKTDTVLEVSPEGELLNEWSVPEILLKNDYAGLLTIALEQEQDPLHLNDVEPFPVSMEEGFFERGDILLSLRNVSTVLVFNRETLRIKFIRSGYFARQHDPDFVDGDTFSVFDNRRVTNRNAWTATEGSSSIVEVNARKGTRRILFEGTDRLPFFTTLAGKHQVLDNGNLLLTETLQGRAIEVTPDGRLVWEYRNYVDSHMIGFLGEVERVAPEYAKPFIGKEATRVKAHLPEGAE